MFKDKLNKLVEKDKEEGNNKKKIENYMNGESRYKA